jgi:hypothetical protein
MDFLRISLRDKGILTDLFGLLIFLVLLVFLNLLDTDLKNWRNFIVANCFFNFFNF